MTREQRASPAGAVESLEIGAEVDVDVERILPGGMGLAHARGQTLLVALAAPGDRVRVQVRGMRGGVAFASIEEILTPSSVRVVPPCPYFGRCGGCDFQQLTYEAQLAAKVEIIRDSLRRVARVEPPADIPITPSPDAWRYRARSMWQYDRRVGSLGYYERGSRTVCDVVECPVIVPELQAVLTTLRERVSREALPEGASDIQAVAGDAGVALAPSVLTGRVAEESARTVGAERYRFNADCFFQINHGLLAPLVDAAIGDMTGDAPAGMRGQRAVDLYCGVGLFTLPLARRFAKVFGVEGNATACDYARRNLADAKLTNAKIEASTVGAWLTRYATDLSPVDFVLLDPPRAGAENETVKGIIALRPTRIAYVSCDPATLARDLRKLLAGGYEIASIAAFDMFPQTHHVETIVHLTRTTVNPEG